MSREQPLASTGNSESRNWQDSTFRNHQSSVHDKPLTHGPCPKREAGRLVLGAWAVKTCHFKQEANMANLWENRAMEESMPRPTRPKLNIRSEDARLRKSSAELTRRAKKFATKWDRISNEGR